MFSPTLLLGALLAAAGGAGPGGTAAWPPPAQANSGEPPALAKTEPPAWAPEVQLVDGVPVLFAAGRPVPSFETYGLANPRRGYASLDGSWEFWWEEGGAGGGGPRPAASQQVSVPGSWDLVAEGEMAQRDGAAWFRRRFELPEGWRGRPVRLVFLGAGPDATVYVDGHARLSHRGSYQPFTVDVSDLAPGPHEVAVRIERRPWGKADYTALPPERFDWWPYAGLLQSVYLEATPPLTVAKVVARAGPGLPADSPPVLQAHVVVENRTATAQRAVVALEAGVEPTATGGERLWQALEVPPWGVRVATFTVHLPGARPWSPEQPTLYQGTASVRPAAGLPAAGDALAFSYGVVDVAVAGSRLVVNGRPFFVKGVNWHADDPRLGASLTEAAIQRDLALAKAAGANTVRLSHYPRHPAVYAWADAHGLFLIDEVPNYWMNASAMAVQLEKGLSRQSVSQMVWDHGNHPSVFLWSLLNECETGPAGGVIARDFVADLVAAVRRLDPRRPVTYASNHLRDDVALDLVDVVGINEYFGFFYGTDSQLGPYLDQLHARYPDKPILVTEFGDWAVAGTPREAEQARRLQRHWDAFRERSAFVAGALWWVFIDHRSRHQPNSAIPFVSTMGLLDQDRRPKQSYQLFSTLAVPAAATGVGSVTPY